ncbi:regulatory protein [Mobilisporobacter senegalensis]|uniref:Regulatory protein RecX n=1 Tax=Mobilisporobacter senegalensis TaxID=1329262 RepID=A0A3N1X6G4_9FIRM|nr:RecX family transcriptional regulator [Mobilisporobacter senegalensis]ROR22355.1 regulatory protein [Mobilisporobacter senegalensis]
MMITRLETIDKKRYKVYIDYEYSFMLYTSDIKRYNIVENEDISEDIYHEIIEDTVYRRAKQKALAILKYMDRTEAELGSKLKQAYYTDEIIKRTIEYVKSYHYIDDERYISNYIQSKKSTKSKKQIQAGLYQKGIDKNLIEECFESELESDEVALQKAIHKKTDNPENLSFEEKQKLIASLCRKGFSYDDIMHFL